jgi:hypothetical protein
MTNKTKQSIIQILTECLKSTEMHFNALSVSVIESRNIADVRAGLDITHSKLTDIKMIYFLSIILIYIVLFNRNARKRFKK